MTKLLTLREFQDYDYEISSIFSGLVAMPNSINSIDMWNLFLIRNGSKYVDPTFKSAEEIKRYVRTLTTVYLPNIEKMWATVDINYPLIENYSMVETVESVNTPNITTSEESTNTNTQTGTGESTSTNSGTNESSTENINATTTFENVSNFSNTDNATSNGSVTNSSSGTSKTDSEIISTGSGTINTLRSGTDTTTTTTTRKGNVGVTTNQQMLQAERDLAQFNFIIYYLELIEKHLFLKIYE